MTRRHSSGTSDTPIVRDTSPAGHCVNSSGGVVSGGGVGSVNPLAPTAFHHHHGSYPLVADERRWSIANPAESTSCRRPSSLFVSKLTAFFFLSFPHLLPLPLLVSFVLLLFFSFIIYSLSTQFSSSSCCLIISERCIVPNYWRVPCVCVSAVDNTVVFFFTVFFFYYHFSDGHQIRILPCCCCCFCCWVDELECTVYYTTLNYIFTRLNWLSGCCWCSALSSKVFAVN